MVMARQSGAASSRNHSHLKLHAIQSAVPREAVTAIASTISGKRLLMNRQMLRLRRITGLVVDAGVKRREQ